MGKQTENFSILDKGLTLEGKLSFQGKMIIKGTVNGTVEGETVIIGEEGAVYADMKAGSLTIGGIFEGKARAMKEFVILSTGNCKGKVICKDIVVEPGGILNAEVTCITIQGEKFEKNMEQDFQGEKVGKDLKQDSQEKVGKDLKQDSQGEKVRKNLKQDSQGEKAEKDLKQDSQGEKIKKDLKVEKAGKDLKQAPKSGKKSSLAKVFGGGKK